MPKYLWLASALFIVYGTSLPFQFVADPELALRKLARVPMTLAVPGASRWGLPDMAQNVLLFLPFGTCGVLALGRRFGVRGAVALVTVLGFALSLGVETLQLFTRNRSSSLNDVATNTIGAFTGALLAPAAASALGRAMRLFEARGLGRTAESFYPLLVATALVALAAWHPFDLALSPSGIWSDVKRLIADPLQAGVFRDEGADAVRYGLLGAAAARWLRDVGVSRPLLAAGSLATVAAILLEGSQVLLISRAPGLKDVLVGAGAAWLGVAAAVSPARRWSPRQLAVLVILLSWAAAAILLLAPFEWAASRRPFLSLPMEGYQRSEPDAAISNVIEIVLLFLPVGFVLARVIGRRALWIVTVAVCVLLMWPLEYLQGWTAGRVPDVSSLFVSALGGVLGAWLGGPLHQRFCRGLR